MLAGLAWYLQVFALLLGVAALFVALLFGSLRAELILFGVALVLFLAGRLVQRAADRSDPSDPSDRGGSRPRPNDLQP
jgi:membrane protein implicated in regulation of membrane protease activity